MVFIAAFSHFFTDFFGAFFKPMAPYFMSLYQIDSSTFGSTLGIISSSASLLQIFFGFLFDRTRRDGLLLFSLLMSQLVILTILVFIRNYYLLMLFIFISIMINSAYHPLGAGLAGRTQKARAIAVFSIFGTFGSALGPVFITAFSSRFEFHSIAWITLASGAVLILLFPKMAPIKKEEQVLKRLPTWAIFKLLVPCFIAVILRSIVMDQFHTFVPIYFNMLNAPLTLGGMVLTIGMLTGLVTNYVGSRWILKVGIFRINLAGFTGMGLAGLLFVLLPGFALKTAMFALFDSAGFLTMSANIVHAQSLVPNNRAFASSVTMGLAWSIGGYIGAGVSAVLGNHVPVLLTVLAGFSLIVALLYLFFLVRKQKTKRPAEA
ncbi:MAG: MFS transporter [Thermotogota bacterium]|nr:MFS transporter [Thermotogota bacterium]